MITSTAPTRSLLTQSDLAGGRSSGFDYMRILLAVAILCFHSCITSYGAAADTVFWDTPLKPFVRLILPMFFALSGFLVAGSLERSRSLLTFLGLRLIRIYPALIVETALSALILGPLLTVLPLRDYIIDPHFGSYLLNILGDIHYLLPGVFLANPEPRIVNGQLWTVPYELACYVTLTALTLVRIKRYRVLAPISAVLVVAAFILARLVKYDGGFPESSTALPGPLLLASFLAGVTFCLYRQEIRHDGRLFMVCAGASLVLLGVIPYGEYLTPFPIAYLTVYLGLLDPKKIGLIKGADYSYGIFLYSFSIQQAVCCLWPWARHWYVNIVVCLPLSAIVAALSWYYVEKPALRLRRPLMAAEAWLLDKTYFAIRLSRL